MKQSKIAAVKKLLTAERPEPLTDSEVKFLKHRKGLHYKSWITDPGLLVILPKDSDEVKQQVTTIAKKLHCMVIVRRCDYKGRKKILLRQGMEKQKEAGKLYGERHPQEDLSIIDKSSHNTRKELAEELPDPSPEDPIIRQTVKLKFPGMFDDIDMDDDSGFRPYIIRNRICRN